MPVARTGGTVSALHDAYLDRLLTWSDIQEYLPFLHETATSYPAVRVLELGTRKGNSTLAFLAAADAAGGHVWSGDIGNIVLDAQGMLPWAGNPRWTFIHGDDMDAAVQSRFPAEVDIFFLDTSHEYEHTLAELRSYMPRVSRGGVALFHDTNLLGWGGNPPRKDYPEVRQALDAYCAETGLSWENRRGTYGMGVIRA
jgi:cephalosporin hydroxylase